MGTPASGQAENSAAVVLDIFGPRRDAEGGADAGSEPGGGNCWICFEGPREAVLLNCGHGGICYACAERCWKLRPRVCPLCRARVMGIAKVAPNPIDPQVYLTQR